MKCKVKIFRTTYNLEIEDGTEERVRQIAEFIDSEMERISREGKLADTYKVAVTALLEITTRYFDLRDESMLETGGIKKRLEMLNRKLEEALV